MTIKVAIVEDDEQVRENLAALWRDKGFECVGTYSSGEQVLETLPRRLLMSC
jgi:FixJ family two-component response regulator